jgi:uncharacterized protein YodC (DUF2158 family)
MGVQLEIGDVVQLNSGGPAMTVVGLSENGRSATCSWFKTGNETEWQSFPKAALKLVEVK